MLSIPSFPSSCVGLSQTVRRHAHVSVTGTGKHDGGCGFSDLGLSMHGGALLMQPNDMRRLDESDDAQYYAGARFVHHADAAFREALTALYRRLLSPGQRVLELCSSWDSHLPEGVELAVTGHGMNAAELQANARLQSSFVQDLNRSPQLTPLADAEFDAVLCCAGIQYLQRPVEVLLEVRRVLKPGGKLVVSFTSHCFPEKAVAAWLARPGMRQRQELVAAYLQAAGFSAIALEGGQEGGQAAADVASRATLRDPFAAVVAARPAAEIASADAVDGARWAPVALQEMRLRGDAEGVTAATLDRWEAAYRQMGEDARSIGIPASAIPALPRDRRVTEAELRRARDHLGAMIASFVSSGL